jgi:hypothetical protein
VAVSFGAFAALRAWHIAADPSDPTDLGQVWMAARALLDGQNPYAVIGPGRPFPFPFVLLYPLTAGVAFVPLAALPLHAAVSVFVFGMVAAFAWALMRHGAAPVLGALAAPMLFATEEAQWSPLLAAAIALPPLGVLFAAKPTIGAAIFAARPSWWPFLGGAVLLVLAFAVMPGWVPAWLGNLALRPPVPGAPAPYLMPVTLGPGPLVLLALLRWRRPEARLLVVLACVPQTTGFYEAAPLALVPRTWGESTTFLVLSWAAFWWWMQYRPPLWADEIAFAGRTVAWCLYLPCLVMVLRRPNEGPLPAWIARRLG